MHKKVYAHKFRAVLATAARVTPSRARATKEFLWIEISDALLRVTFLEATKIRLLFSARQRKTHKHKQTNKKSEVNHKSRNHGASGTT